MRFAISLILLAAVLGLGGCHDGLYYGGFSYTTHVRHHADHGRRVYVGRHYRRHHDGGYRRHHTHHHGGRHGRRYCY